MQSGSGSVVQPELLSAADPPSVVVPTAVENSLVAVIGIVRAGGTTTVTLPLHCVSVKPAQFVAVAQNGKKYRPGAAVANVKSTPASICSALNVSNRGLLSAYILSLTIVKAFSSVVYTL